MTDVIYSVSQLNRTAKRLLGDYFATVWVSGEISNLSAPASGHLYFTLKDAQAQVRCALFKAQRAGLSAKPANGQQVLVSAQVSLYEPRGDYQLIVDAITELGDGALRLAFERLKHKLQTEGLFEQTRKKPLPTLPNCIGVITSPSGAAVRDILTVLKQRFPAIPVIIYPVAVQGENAKTEIVRALAQANQLRQADVLILGRGGGSLEDLQAFNEENVARAIAASDIPVIAAVGHETDITIADFVADLRAATPSAAAALAAPRQEAWLQAFNAQEIRLTQLMRRQLNQRQQTLDWLYKALQQQHPGQQLKRNQEHLSRLTAQLTWRMKTRLQLQQRRLQLAEQAFNARQPEQRLRQERQRALQLQHRLRQSMQTLLQQHRRRHAAASQLLHAVSPLATLERGYSISQRQGDRQIVKSAQQLAAGDLLLTRFAHGQTISLVQDIIHD
jgi:exodeoxyribonuclease VII large subunit